MNTPQSIRREPRSRRRCRPGRRRPVSGIITLVVGVAAAATTLAPSVATAAAARVTICHQVGNLSYRVITVDVNSVTGGGHGHHSGDIIPAFNATQGNRELHFGGRNLGLLRDDGLTGAQVLAAGCTVPRATTAQAPPTSSQVAVPVPDSTLAPTQTTQATPTSTNPAVPTTAAQATLAPETTVEAVPTSAATVVPSTEAQTTLAPETTVEAVPTSAATVVPSTEAQTKLAPETTVPATCAPGELAHRGECFPIPELVVPAVPELTTITSQPETGSLLPTVECVHERADGVEVVWFSYESTSNSPVVVERGPSNQVAPRGTPPTLFGPGLHIFVLAVETTDGEASWTLAGETATSTDDSPDCEETGTTVSATSEPSVSATSEPAAVSTTAPDAPATTGTATTEPSNTQTTEPSTPTTEPNVTTTTTQPDGQPSTPSTCPAGQAEIDGTCAPIEPVRLVLVDNVVECDGHGVARFAAFNDNVFALENQDITSLVAPTRLADDAPQVLDERDVESDDGTASVALFTVRYVTAVTWTVSHHGLEASVSAGVGGAEANPDCPLAVLHSAGAHGLLSPPSPMPTTGADTTIPLSIAAALACGFGLALVLLVRRRPDQLG